MTTPHHANQSGSIWRVAAIGCVVGILAWLTRTTAPFLVGALVMPMAWIIHPVWYDAGRILAPVWVSLNLGIGLLVEWAAGRFHEPIQGAVAWATDSEGQPA